EIERLNDEIRSYLANDEDQREALREDYADAREVVEARRDVEVADLRSFRSELLARIRESEHRTVTESLDRMRLAAADEAERVEIRTQLDELERHFEALLEAAEKRTTALIETRARRRNKQLQDLEAELAAKESDLDQKKARFAEERHWAIQTAKRSRSTRTNWPLEGPGPRATLAGPLGRRAAPPADSDTTPATSNTSSAASYTGLTGSYSAPARSYTAPATSNTAPAASYTGLTGSNTPPAGSYTAPATSNTVPATSNTAPTASYTAPAGSYTAPAGSYTAPAGSYTAPAGSYDAPATWHTAPGALNSTTAVEEIVR
ncbi:MAG: hypothetical protein ACYTFT_13320, partial [Planctomycetota bacterium]